MTAIPEDKWLNASGINLHYLDWGNPSAPPMVLLHGFCSQAHYWDFFACSLKTDYHVMAPDMRGHGDSEWASSYSLQEGALDLAECIATLKLENIALIGISMGGLVSLLCTAMHPEFVSKLIIVDIGPELATDGLKHIQKDLTSEPEFFNSEDEAFRYLKQTQPLTSDTFIKHQVSHTFKRDETGRLRFKYDKSMCRVDLQSPEWLWEYLEKIKSPALIVRAQKSDILSKENAQKMLTKLAHGKLVEIPNASHTVVGDNPEGFEAAVRGFLAAGGRR